MSGRHSGLRIGKAQLSVTRLPVRDVRRHWESVFDRQQTGEVVTTGEPSAVRSAIDFVPERARGEEVDRLAVASVRLGHGISSSASSACADQTTAV